jgi:hypothetical protein
MGQKTLPTIWGTYMKLVTKYQISVINSCWEKCKEKCAYKFNVYKNQLSRQTGSRNLMGPKTWRKIFWTDGRTDRGKTVYPPPPSGSGGIIKVLIIMHSNQEDNNVVQPPRHLNEDFTFFHLSYIVFGFFISTNLNTPKSYRIFLLYCST